MVKKSKQRIQTNQEARIKLIAKIKRQEDHIGMLEALILHETARKPKVRLGKLSLAELRSMERKQQRRITRLGQIQQEKQWQVVQKDLENIRRLEILAKQHITI